MSNALQAVLDRVTKEPEGKPSRPPAAAPPRPAAKRHPPVERAATAPDLANEAAREKFFRPARVGKRFVGAHFHPEVARQLKMLAAEDDRTIQELLEDAVDLLFVKAGKARIAELVKKP
jgi:hypothetical protein